jgi:hypothetical protein
VHRRCKLAEGGSHPARKALAFDGKANATSRALREPDAEIRFQRLDLVADRAMRYVESFRSPRQAPLACRGVESPKRMHRRQADGHDPFHNVNIVHIMLENKSLVASCL